jgi:hypothetical protein
MTPQKVKNHIIKNMLDSEGAETSVSQIKRMMKRMFKEFKEDTENKSMNSMRICINSLRRHKNN